MYLFNNDSKIFLPDTVQGFSRSLNSAFLMVLSMVPCVARQTVIKVEMYQTVESVMRKKHHITGGAI